MNYLNSLYQQVILSISIVLPDCEKQVKVRRPPKVSDLQIACLYVVSYMKVSTFGIHKMAWLMVSKRFPWNAKYETVYRWFASYIVIYTIMELKS